MRPPVSPVALRIYWFGACAIMVTALVYGSLAPGASAPQGPRGIWRVIASLRVS